MEKKLIEQFIGKQVLVSTNSSFTFEGRLELNNSKSYPEEEFMVITNSDYTYFVSASNVKNIVEWDRK